MWDGGIGGAAPTSCSTSSGSGTSPLRSRPALGGERQRVAIARALARDPQVLLLDEPLSSLDPATRGCVTGELGALLRTLGLTTVIVTHSYDDAAALADWIAVVEHGAIVQTGSGEELLASPASAFVADFAGINLLAGTATAGSDGLTHIITRSPAAAW